MGRHLDLLPTFAELTGATLPEKNEEEGQRLFGLREFKAHLEMSAPNPDGFKDKLFAVRDEKWRLVEGQLFDLESDPGEKTVVSAKHPEVVAKMRAAYEAWWKESRPGMVNETADLKTGKPFVEAFKKQKEERGIPKWEHPRIK